MVNKKFWLGIPVIVLVFGMTVIGCSSGSEDDDIVSKETLNGKWETVGSEKSTFEFTTDNVYVVEGSFGQPSRAATQVYTGKYTISDTIIILEGFGVIEVVSFSVEEFRFSLKLNNSNQTYNFQAVKKENTIASSSRTNLLCRNWKVVRVSDPGHNDAIGEGILFSRAGTYLVTHRSGTTALAEWRWKNTEQTIFQYSWDHWGSFGDVQIQDLTASSFKLVDYGDRQNSVTYELVLAD